MIAKAYRMADAVRTAGLKVVMAALTSQKWPMRPSGEMAARAMPTRLLSAKPMRRGPELHCHAVGTSAPGARHSVMERVESRPHDTNRQLRRQHCGFC